MKQNLIDLIKRYWEYLIVLMLAFPPLLWFRDGFVLLGHDAGFRFDYLAQLPNLFYSWDPKYNLGVDWSIFKGFLVTQIPEVAFSSLTRSFAAGEKIALVFWFAVMGIGILILLRSVFPEHKYRFFRIFSSLFYMYNYFILSGWTIGERGKFSLYAALPIGLLLIYNVYVRKHSILRSGLWFGLLYLFLSGGGALPLYGATFVVLGLAFVYFARGKPVVFVAKTLAAFVIPFLLLNAYYILPSISLLRSSYDSSIGAQGGIDGLIAWERVISSHASFINLLRLQGVPMLYDNPWQPFTHVILTNPGFVAASFGPILVILLGFLYFRPKHALIRFFALLLPFGLVFAMGTHPPTGILFEFAMKKIPGFAMFRSSFYKFAPALWFPMIVLTGYFLNELLGRLKHRSFRIALGVLLTVLLLVYHYPFFTTEQFAIGNGFSTRVRVPDYLNNITGDMKRYVGENDAVLVMPKMKEFSPALPGDMYTWHFFGLDIFPRNAVNRRFVANDSKDPIVGRLYDVLYAGDTEKFHELVKILGINYVLWRGDAIGSPDSSTLAQAMLRSDPSIRLVYETGLWSLYRIDEIYEGAVTTTGQFHKYTGTDAGSMYLIETYGTVVDQGEDFLEAECIMCNVNEYTKLVDAIVLPKTRIVPGSPLFFIEQWRQNQLISQVKDNPRERIDGDLALALKYRSWSSPEKSDAFLKDALDMWKTLSGRERVLYAIRLKAYLEALKQPVPDELTRSVWMSEAGIYRYIVPVREGYTIETSKGKLTANSARDGLDFIEVRSGGDAPFVFLKRTAKSSAGVSPSITFRKVNPTNYRAHIVSDGKFLLILKEHYDPRWKVSVAGSHVKVNGYANGWIIDQKGSYDITMYYGPQLYVYAGMLVSGISLLSSIYYLIKK